MDHLFVHILVFSLLIQTVQASQVICADGRYRECPKCPDNCLKCVSSMNCTQCKHGFYDSICDKPCKKPCPHPYTCHKEYGFCKYGCPDGQFSTLDNKTCLNCTESCEICESLSVCFRCKDGKYGETCHKCPENCLKCVSKTNCTQCKHGYYDSICDKPCKEECPHPHTCHKVYGFCPHGCLDGQYYIPDNKTCGNCTENCEICKSPSVCFRCTDGKYDEICQHPCPVDHCVQCEQSSGECLQCRDTFFLVDGQCKSCPFRCRLCNSTNNCLSCEDKFLGPTNGYCLFQCPDSDVSTYKMYNMTDRCRIVPGTDINTCDGYSDRYKCATSGYCLQNRVCPKSAKCVGDSTEQTLCAIDMQYTCDQECQQKYFFFLLCKTTCSVRKSDRGINVPFRLGDDILSLIVEPFKKIDKMTCHRPKDTIDKTNGTILALSITIVVLLLIIGGGISFAIYKYKCWNKCCFAAKGTRSDYDVVAMFEMDTLDTQSGTPESQFDTNASPDRANNGTITEETPLNPDQQVAQSKNPVSQCDTNASPDGDNNGAITEETTLNPDQQFSKSGNPVSQCDINASPDGDNNGALTKETPLNPDQQVAQPGNPVSQRDTNASPDGDNNGALTEETPLNSENNHCIDTDQCDFKDIQKYPEDKCQ